MKLLRLALTGTLLGCVTVAIGTGLPTPTVKAAGEIYLDMVFPSAEVTHSVVYATAPNLVDGTAQNLLIDIYQPSGDVRAQRPVLLAIHGGGFRVGGRISVADWATEWARRGYVVLGVDYRLDPGNKCQDLQDGKVSADQFVVENARCTAAIIAAQHDSQAVVRWARAHAVAYRIDPSRIGAIGSSAGAVTTVHLAQRSDDPGDVGDNDAYDSRIQAGLAMSGCNYEQTSIGAGDAPVSMLHAQFDGAVPFQCAIDTVAASRASGADSETILYYGEGTHAIDLYRKYQTAVDARWTQFLIREMNLGNQVAAGSKAQIHGTPNRSAVISLTATQSVGGGFLQALSCSATPGSTSNLNTDAAGQTRAGLAIVHFDATGTACIYTSFQTHLVVDLQGYLADTAFNDVTDSRLLDTRNGARPLAGSSSQIHGTPDTSAVISLVSTQGRGGGWLQALPCGTTPGSTSNLNTDEAGQTRAGLAIVRFDATGTACIYTSAGAHIVVDLQGYLAPTAFDDIADVRLVDTRTGVRVAANSKTVIRGTANRSAFVSLVSTQAVGGGWLQVLPCSATPGSTSNLNADQANLTIAGAAVAQFDTNGEACVYSSVSTHLVVDLQGYFTTGSFDDIADVRLLDTRMS